MKPEKITFAKTHAQMEQEGNHIILTFTLPTDEPHPNTLEFFRKLGMIGVMHISKGADYGLARDPFSNVRSSEEFGIPGWVGSVVRGNDKMRRIQKASSQTIQNGKASLENEGVEDSLLDLAVYCLISSVLLGESEKS